MRSTIAKIMCPQTMWSSWIFAVSLAGTASTCLAMAHVSRLAAGERHRRDTHRVRHLECAYDIRRATRTSRSR